MPTNRMYRKLPSLPIAYKYIKEIAQGGQASVWLVLNKNIGTKGRYEAVKILHRLNKKEYVRFCREIEALAALEHPNIVTLYYAKPKEAYFIMEYLTGGSFLLALRHKKFSLSENLQIILQILNGLGYAHQKGIIHRDLKPQNILFSAKNIPKITDFGIVKAVETNHITGTKVAMGTPKYMAPEQWEDSRKVDHRSDLWSLGIVLYRILCNRAPFAGFSGANLMYAILMKPIPHPVISTSSKEDCELANMMIPICMKALKRSRRKRYQSAWEMAQDIDKVLQKFTAKDGKQGSEYKKIDTSELAFLCESPVDIEELELDHELPLAPTLRQSAVRSAADVIREGNLHVTQERHRYDLSPRLHQKHPQKTYWPLLQRGAIFFGVAVVLAFAYKLLLAPPAKSQIPSTETERSIVKRDYLAIRAELNRAMNHKFPSKWKTVLQKAQAFQKKYPQSLENRELQIYVRQLYQRIRRILSYDFEQTANMVKKHLQQQQFAAALDRITHSRHDAFALFPELQLELKINKLRNHVLLQAKEDCQQHLLQSETLQKQRQFVDAYALLQRAKSRQLPENLAKIERAWYALQKLHWQYVKEQNSRLQQQAHFAKVLTLLNQAREYQTPDKLPWLSKEIAKIKTWQTSVDKWQQLLPFQAKICRLLRKWQFVQVQEHLTHPRQSLLSFAVELAKLRKIAANYRNLEQFFSKLLQNEFKNKQFDFIFAGGEKFTAQVVKFLHTRQLLLLKTKDNRHVSRPLSLLTWNCKKKMLGLYAEQYLPAGKDSLSYRLALLLLVENDLYTLKGEIKSLSPQDAQRIREPMVQFLGGEMMRLIADSDTLEIRYLLREFAAFYTGSDNWGSLQHWLAASLYQASTKHNNLCELVVLYLPQSAYYQCCYQKTNLDNEKITQLRLSYQKKDRILHYIKRLDDEDNSKVRNVIIRKMNAIDLPFLAEIWRSKRVSVQEKDALLEILTDIGGAKSILFCIELLQHPDYWRKTALLFRKFGTMAMPQLLPLIVDRQKKQGAKYALACMGRQAILYLQRELQNNQQALEIRMAIPDVLMQASHSRIAALDALLQYIPICRDRKIRQAMWHALKKIAPEHVSRMVYMLLKPNNINKYHTQIYSILASNDKYLLKAIKPLLKMWKKNMQANNRRTSEPLESMMIKIGRKKSLHRKITSDLIGLLHNHHSYIRIGAIRILGKIKAASAVFALQKIAKEERDQRIRHAAKRALSQIK